MEINKGGGYGKSIYLATWAKNGIYYLLYLTPNNKPVKVMISAGHSGIVKKILLQTYPPGFRSTDIYQALFSKGCTKQLNKVEQYIRDSRTLSIKEAI